MSHLMKHLCKMMGIKKFNTTAHHPQCDSMVEQFNQTLKAILCKHAATYGNQWDSYLFSALYAYPSIDLQGRNLMFGIDCSTPTESAFLPPSHFTFLFLLIIVTLALSTAKIQLHAAVIQQAQHCYKTHYDKNNKLLQVKIGDCVLICSPSDESSRNHRLL